MLKISFAQQGCSCSEGTSFVCWGVVVVGEGFQCMPKAPFFGATYRGTIEMSTETPSIHLVKK